MSRRARRARREPGVPDAYQQELRSRRTPDALIALVAARQHGTIHVRQLYQCGLNDHQILRRVRKGWLHPLYRAVYAVGHANVGFEGKLFAATLASGGPAWGARGWAAVALGMEQGIEGEVQVLVPGRGAPRLDGIPITSPAPPRTPSPEFLAVCAGNSGFAVGGGRWAAAAVGVGGGAPARALRETRGRTAGAVG